MLVPKRVKHRKQMRGRRKGKAYSGSTVAFGEYGLQSLEAAWITNRQIEAALGNQQLQQLAASFGVPLDQISNLLSTHLPAAVDQASPTGTLQK